VPAGNNPGRHFSWAKIAERSPAADVKALGNALFKAKESPENVKSAIEKSEEVKKIIEQGKQ
jgi:hypothetical protein